eukprot:g7804.t1
MGRSGKVTRVHSHSKAKRQAQGKLWKKSAKVKYRLADKKARKNKLKLKGDVVRTNARYCTEAGYRGTFVGTLQRELDSGWRVKWQDGSVQDGVQESWFERVVKDGAGGWKPKATAAAVGGMSG